jgi:serine phosphatase RsbU (regulator of sigma subunit)
LLAATIRALLRARSAESEVRLAAREWSATFDAISDAVAVLAPDGSLLRANRSFEQIFDEPGTDRRALDLAGVESGDELQLGSRVFQVRVDRIDHEQRLVVTLSDITAALAVEQERAAALATEQTISRTLQQSLLPERLPARPHLELHAWHVAAESELIVGGDWYDVIETPAGLWLVMGDIAGHGVVAAAQAGQLRHSMRVYAHEGYGIVESLDRLNELVRTTGLTQMATLAIVAVDDDAQTGRLALAGHPPPLVVPRAGEAHFAESAPGAPLGVTGATYAESSVELALGDRLVLYTDGLIERPGESIDDGLERMRRSAEGVDGLEPLRAKLVRELSGVADLRDDVALLLARRV